MCRLNFQRRSLLSLIFVSFVTLIVHCCVIYFGNSVVENTKATNRINPRPTKFESLAIIPLLFNNVWRYLISFTFTLQDVKNATNNSLVTNLLTLKPIELRHMKYLLSSSAKHGISLENITIQFLPNTEFEDIMNTRVQNMHKICNDPVLVKKQTPLNSANIYWFQHENIAYCPIFKAASTTWVNNLIAIAEVPQKTKDELKQKYLLPISRLKHVGAINPTLGRWSSYISKLRTKNNITGFILVRHPFERLVSAYRDKLERKSLTDRFYYEKYGKYFVARYRRKAIEVLGAKYFTEQNNFGTPIKVPDNRRPNADLSSFWEFAQAVIDRYKMNKHWIPINEYCSICNPITLKAFHYILKFEELKKEEEQFLIHFHWNTRINKPSKLNVNLPRDLSSKELTQLYFSSLTQEKMIELYNVYALDFLLFNYTFHTGDLDLPLKDNGYAASFQNSVRE